VEAALSFEMLASYHITTRHNPKDHDLNFHSRGNLKSHNIKMEGWEDVDWIQLAQDRDQRRAVVKTVMNL
jgi:hypothetical protein